MTINHLSSGGIITNYKCPAACGHCLYSCSPNAKLGYISWIADRIMVGLTHMPLIRELLNDLDIPETHDVYGDVIHIIK